MQSIPAGNATTGITGGGLRQLIAYGAPDIYLTCSGDNPAYNINTYNNCWFVDSDDGVMDKNTMAISNSIFEHYPEYLKPSDDIEISFNTGVEKMISRIQNRLRHAIQNPSYVMCQKRLLGEFDMLSTE